RRRPRPTSAAENCRGTARESPRDLRSPGCGRSPRAPPTGTRSSLSRRRSGWSWCRPRHRRERIVPLVPFLLFLRFIHRGGCLKSRPDASSKRNARDRDEPPPVEAVALGAQIERDGGTTLATYREPVGGHWQIFCLLPMDKLEPTPYQRDLSPAHVKRL